METPQVRLRPATPEDVNFIFSSWLKSFRNSLSASKIANPVYFSEHHKLIEQLLRSSKVIIACNNDDSNQLYGYVVAGEVEGIFALHFLYVKHTFRRLGIGRILLNAFPREPGAAGIYTHYTRNMEDIAPKFELMYQPYVLPSNYGKGE